MRMNLKIVLSFPVLLLWIISSKSQAQIQDTVKKDSTLVFGTMQPLNTETTKHTPRTAWGVDVLISTNGFGLGTFLRHEYSEDLSGYLDFSISEAKDDNEKEVFDYWGNRYTLNKINRFLVLPLYVGLEQRLFSDDIIDNFRPYLNAAAGPTMIYVFPYNEEYFNALGHGSPKYTIGGYIGVGAYFGSERSNVMGINIRYYFIPYPGGLESLQNSALKKEFGGFYLTLNFGSAW